MLMLPVEADIQDATQVVADRLGGWYPEIGVILGSGLGALVEAITDPVTIPYHEIPGFPVASIGGHKGCLVAGTLGRRRVVMLQGRAHVYEHDRADVMTVPVAMMARLGCRHLIVTNAAGTLRTHTVPGSVMMLSDHINLTGRNPLIGATGDGRFVDLVNAYDKGLRCRFRELAMHRGIPLTEGVYMWFIGPSFETPAEIRLAQALGVDAVGMSTVPEVIVARACEMKVTAFSLITNQGAGLSDTPLSHAQTLACAGAGAERLRRLILAYMEDKA